MGITGMQKSNDVPNTAESAFSKLHLAPALGSPQLRSSDAFWPSPALGLDCAFQKPLSELQFSNLQHRKYRSSFTECMRRIQEDRKMHQSR